MAKMTREQYAETIDHLMESEAGRKFVAAMLLTILYGKKVRKK